MSTGTSPTLSPSISASVGRGGKNLENDVRTVQTLLNAAGAGIKVDGDCGRATISAIEEYQRNWIHRPDGRVDAGGTTWKNLVEKKLKIVREGYLVLPQLCGNGYYSYSTVDRQYGTAATIATLIEVCKKFVEKYPDLQVGIGDMSLATGAPMAPHKTHRNGKNADIRPLRTDGKISPVSIIEAEYSRERTKALVEILQKQSNLKSILFNDSAIVGVTHWEGHDNHLHVSMKA
jgi:peptidoglycan hydrolase-like protein with peptidoglycan-binding domain